VIYAGARSPEAIEVVISGINNPEVDLNDATSVELQLISRSPVVTWIATIIEKTATRLTARYTFTVGGLDVPKAEYLKIAPEVLLSGGERVRCVPTLVSVVQI